VNQWTEQSQAPALEADTEARALARALEPIAYTTTYDEVLANSKLRHIIYSIDPDLRRGLAHDLWRSSHTSQGHWWFIQIIVPITRLPLELLQQIFLIIIDEPSHSPLMLMLVCKNWCTIVTGIWASLKLGTRTLKHAVTSKLERNQWLLDVVVDTEIDRGDFTPSEGAYEAIFAALEATPRWRTFVVETFPGQADLPKPIVNRGLQRCPNAGLAALGHSRSSPLVRCRLSSTVFCIFSVPQPVKS